MKSITVKRIDCNIAEADKVPSIMDEANINWNNIDNVNWPTAFPYRPDVKFRIAHTGNTILLQFQVTEQQVRAEIKEDNGQVFRDACCEFFLRPRTDGPYYNIETNCLGVMLIECGMSRGAARKKATKDILANVGRWASLAEQPLPEGECSWQLALTIPCSTFFKDNISDLSGKRMKGNFYKTGDDLAVPHYLSWNKIKTSKPDFHTPLYFGEIVFE